MKYKDWSDFRIYCSRISNLLTQPRGFTALSKSQVRKYDQLSSKPLADLTEKELKDLEYLENKQKLFLNPPVLSATAQGYLIEMYSRRRYGLRQASSGGLSKSSVIKGFALEKEGLDLLSKIDNINYSKETEPISDDYFIGVCDIVCPINNKVIDIKTSWNAANFMKNRNGSFNLPLSVWAQVQGYMHLYKLQKGQACYVLVNTPPHLIEQEWSNLFKRYAYGEITREKYDDDCYKLQGFFNYNKIPDKRRVIRFNIDYSSDFIAKAKQKVDMAREWLNDFERLFMSGKNIPTHSEFYLRSVPDIDTSEEDPI